MDGLQKKVYGKQGLGAGGLIAKGLHCYNVLHDAITQDNECYAGGFIQSAAGGVKNASGTAISGKILGVAIKSGYYPEESPSVKFKKGSVIHFMNQGIVFIQTDKPCKNFQYVFLKNDDGSIAFDDTTTKSDHTFTGFQVIVGTNDTVDTDRGFDIIAIQK